jgi:hypothetical protein
MGDLLLLEQNIQENRSFEVLSICLDFETWRAGFEIVKSVPSITVPKHFPERKTLGVGAFFSHFQTEMK